MKPSAGMVVWSAIAVAFVIGFRVLLRDQELTLARGLIGGAMFAVLLGLYLYVRHQDRES